MERRITVYSGRVQGVGFRATARSVAGGFRVTGWVRNEPGGDVRLEVQGDPAEVDRFLESLRAAMLGNISSERATPAPTEPGESGFSIRR